MPLDQPPNLRILNDKQNEYMVQFSCRLLDHQDIASLNIPYLVTGDGGLVKVDLLRIQSPLRDNIPPVRMLQFTAAHRPTPSATTVTLADCYLYNPTTQQAVCFLPNTPFATVNACIPFYMDRSASLWVFRASGSDPNVNTNAGVFLYAELLTYDVPSYWHQSSASGGTQIVQAANEASAISSSTANPQNFYYWV